MSDRRWPTVAVTVVLLTLGASATALGQPPRDPGANSPVMPTGKGSITGRVIVAGTGQPARRARVNLNGSAEAGGSVSTTTDDQGRFAFNTLPEGRFSLSASKPGHISASYGQRRPGRPGTPIQLAAGQRLQVQIQIWRGGVLTGTLLDEQGEAIPGTPVRALRFMMQNGERTLQSAGNGQTDDRGVYRIYGLQPGDYLVNATPRNASGPDEDRMLAEVRALTQRIQAMPAASAEETRAAMTRLSMLQSTDPSADDGSTGYAPVYYPGTTAPANAQTISLGPGEEKGGIDFQYQVVPIARIDGIVSGVQSAQGVQLTLVNTGFDVPGVGPGNARVDQQGTFRISNVPPGQYRLIARANVSPDGQSPRGAGPGRGGMAPGGRMGGPGSQQTRLWATADVTVDGRNVSNVVLTLQPGMAFTGRIAFEGALSIPPDLSRVRVTLAPIQISGATGNVSMPAAAMVDNDGRFTIASVTPGRYRVSASAPGGWYLGSVAIEGQDALDFPIEVKPNQSVSNAVITFTDKQTELTGTVVNDRSQPMVDYSVLVYPADKRFVTAFSRRIQTTRPATDGRFSFRNLPAGEYRLVAVLDPEPGSWLDPSFLDQLDSSATRVSLSEGEKKDQTLRVATGG
jgi:Carboxypeptidase regulatory-like domain